MLSSLSRTSLRYSRYVGRNIRNNIDVNTHKNGSNLHLGSMITNRKGTQFIQTRQMSIFNFFSSPKPPTPPPDETAQPSDPNVNSNNEAMQGSFSDSTIEIPIEGTSETIIEVFSDLAADSISEIAAASIPTGSYNPKYQVMNLIVGASQYLGVPYWEAIVIVTLGVRILMLPLAIKTVVGSSRLAAVRPKIQKLQDAMNNDPLNQSLEAKKKIQADMMAIFKKHKVNPFMTMLWPLFQLPVFMCFFFALQDIQNYVPAYQMGGAYWFVNLNMADPYMALPIINCLGFLAIAQIGGEGMDQFQKPKIKWGMRALGVAMIPLTMHMPAGLFIHWVTQAFVAISQSLLFKVPFVKKALGILDFPKTEMAATKEADPFDNFIKAVKREVQPSNQPDILDAEFTPIKTKPGQVQPLTFLRNPNRQEKVKGNKG